MTDEKIRLVARALILNDKNQILLGRRARGRGVNQWALVGGKPEGDESIEETIVREVEEELGLIFNPNYWKDEIDATSNPGEIWKVIYFWGPFKGKLKLNKEEITEVLFVGPEEFGDLDIAFDHRGILADFFRNYPQKI